MPGRSSALRTTVTGLLGLSTLVTMGAIHPEALLVRFTDVAPRSAFSYVSNNDFTGRKYFPQPMCGGIAVLDVDLDGRPDLFFTNGAKLPELTRPDPSFHNCLLRNRGDGTFEDITARAGLTGADLGFSFGVAAGDYDNDGHTDLFLCNAGRNALYHNNGDGTFTDVTAASGLDRKRDDLLSVVAAFFDYDNDGLLDLVVSQYTYWDPRTDRRCTSGDHEIYCHPANYPPVPHNLYRNLGGGRFEDVTEKSGFAAVAGKGMGVAIADFDGDGTMDVFVANDTEPNFLYINKGDGTFAESSWDYEVAFDPDGSRVSGMGADARDFDNDGWVDIFYNNLRSQIWALFRNEAGDHFRYVSARTGVAALSRPYSGWSNGFIDFDNDGWKDIYSANGDIDSVGADPEQNDTMFRNLEGEGFDDVSARLGPDFLRKGYQRGSAFADLNGDGFLDIVVTSLNRRPRILMSSGDNGNHWLMVDARGRRSNRDAVGTRIKVTTASGRVLHNHVSVSVGFMGSSDRRVHFGLGRETAVRSVEVRWPSGAVQELKDVSVDQVLKLDEPD